MDNLTLALWQTPYAVDTAQALAQLDSTAADAKVQGADLLLCPEMCLTGYAIGAQQVKALSEAADGPMAQSVASIAQRHQIAIVYGYPERHPDGLQPFNAAQAIAANGHPVGRYRKTHLFGDIDRQQFTAGEAASQVFEYRGWRLGLLICYDVEFPETVRLLALQGADALLVPTANMAGFDEVPNVLLPARACENRLYLAYANACGSENRLNYGGLSAVVNANGEVIASAKQGAALLIAQLAPDHLASARQHSQLPHRRPDLYRPLSVKEWQHPGHWPG
jgi:predicted amidohydrolase